VEPLVLLESFPAEGFQDLLLLMFWLRLSMYGKVWETRSERIDLGWWISDLHAHG